MYLKKKLKQKKTNPKKRIGYKKTTKQKFKNKLLLFFFNSIKKRSEPEQVIKEGDPYNFKFNEI